jgi:hypothetical protein
MPLVVDASVALAWALPDESPTSADERAFLAALPHLSIEVEEASEQAGIAIFQRE